MVSVQLELLCFDKANSIQIILTACKWAHGDGS